MNKKLIKKVILRGQLFTLCLYTFIYLCTSFVTWSFNNPFNWLLKIPYEDIDYRLNALLGGLIYYGILYGITYAMMSQQIDQKQKFVEKFQKYFEFIVIQNERINQFTNTETEASLLYDELRKERIMI